MTVEKLQEILKTVPPNSILVPNAVGNLAVWSNDTKEYVGYIDFDGETYEVY